MWFLYFIFALAVSTGVWAQSNGVARVVTLRGTATVKTTSAAIRPLMRGDPLAAGDQIATSEDSQLRVLMNDRSLIDLGSNSTITIKKFETQQTTRSVSLRLFAGRLWAHVTKTLAVKTDFEVETPTAVAGVRGTEFVVDVDYKTGGTTVTVIEGRVEVIPHGMQSGQVLGRLTRGQVNKGASNVQTNNITADEAQKTTSDVQSGSSRPQGSLPNTLPQDNTSKNPQTPPIDLDPGAGRTRVRGKIEIKGK
jgi:hypothetical protein